MNLQQLRSVRETVRQGFNLTQAAGALRTSQPNIGRQIRSLEGDLGIDIFTRDGLRLTGLTPQGAAMLPFIERLLLDADSLRLAADDIAAKGDGVLTVAATQSLAQYTLPPAVRDFAHTHPTITLRMHQSSPHQVAQLLLHGEADLGVTTEALNHFDDLVTLPCDSWTHTVIVPAGHALDDGQPLTLQRLAAFPVITYEPGYAGRSQIDQAFLRHGIDFDVVLSAVDAEVIKTYVGLGMGVGIVASLAYNESRDQPLRALDASHLFATSITHLALRKGAYLRAYVYDFILTFASSLTRDLVNHAVAQAHAPTGDA